MGWSKRVKERKSFFQKKHSTIHPQDYPHFQPRQFYIHKPFPHYPQLSLNLYTLSTFQILHIPICSSQAIHILRTTYPQIIHRLLIKRTFPIKKPRTDDSIRGVILLKLFQIQSGICIHIQSATLPLFKQDGSCSGNHGRIIRTQG